MGKSQYIVSRLGGGIRREYKRKWELLADTSRAPFTCIQSIQNPMTRRVTSLWGTTLADKRELFIISINRPAEHPQYDRGIGDRAAAFEFFNRYLETQK